MYLGIDLGTSNSAIVGNLNGDLRLFKSAEGHDVLPSVISIDKRGHKFIGARAYEQAVVAPQNVAAGFKRLMGTSSPVSFAAAGLTMSPEECSAEILRTLIRQMRTEAGDVTIEGAIVTIPAAFNQMQSEATVRAANEAGLDRVGLLQEPIAAAMASMLTAKKRDGQFLVFDLGGGTFDVALVQSIGGSVNVVAHEGINMLGGRDFDRRLVDSVVRPWLLETFNLPPDLKPTQYRRLLDVAKWASEKAKIELTTAEKAVIFADDGQVRTQDLDGEDIYISVEVTRATLERLIADEVERSIALCRKLLSDNGYNNEDIERVVLIGGPTKMPTIRTRVPQELGIPIDLQVDPMTAVATGAAIFAESREWIGGSTKRKPARATSSVNGPLQLRYDYPARTAENQIKVRIRTQIPGAAQGHSLQIDTPQGTSSGSIALKDDLLVEMPLTSRGENRFRVTVFGPDGAPVPQAGMEFTVTRAHAAAAGIPATQTISVKVVEDSTGEKRNELEPLIEKGTLLPSSGTKTFKAARDLVGGQPGHIAIELFQQAPGVIEPELNLGIGAFRLDAIADLEPGQRIRRGDEVIIHWKMDDNGLLECSIELPGQSLHLQGRRFYTPIAGHQNFEGEDGEQLAVSALSAAHEDLEQAESALTEQAETELDALRRRLNRQAEELKNAHDPDAKRAITEEARAIRQEISRLKHAPDHRAAVLRQEFERKVAAFESDLREHTDPRMAQVFDRLRATVESSLEIGDCDGAERALREMSAIAFQAAMNKPAYVIALFRRIAKERYLALDKELHARLIREGEAAIAASDMEEVRSVMAQMVENRMSIGGTSDVTAAIAGLKRA